MCVLPEEVQSCLTSFDYRNFKIISIVLISVAIYLEEAPALLDGSISLLCLVHCKPKGCQQSPCHLLQPGQVTLFSHHLLHVCSLCLAAPS